MIKTIIILILSIYFISCDNRNREIILDDECRGRITEIYQEQRNHYVYQFKVIVNNNNRVFIADFYPTSWKYASIGDSIIKKKGESFITIKKKDGSCRVFETRIQ